MPLLYKENSSSGSDLITQAEAKNWIKVDSDLTADDDVIDDLIISARRFVEHYMNQSTISYNITIRFTSEDLYQDKLFLKFRGNPTDFVLNKTYLGVQTLVATSVYEINEYLNCIQLKYDQTWPDAEYFEATYDTYAVTDADVKICMLNHLAMDYEYRRGGKEMNLGKIYAALKRKRIWMLK